jgi:glycosyl transferase, family 25
MDIVVINLERSTDRRAHMTAMLRRAGLEFCFVRAIDASAGEQLGFQQYDAAAARRAHGEELTPGEVACFASHYLLWRRSLETNRPLLVLEDDVVLGPRFGVALSLANELIDRYGFIRLQGGWIPAHDHLGNAKGFSLVRMRKGPYGTGAYALSPQAARALFDHSCIWRFPVDLHLSRFWEYRLPMMALLPYPVEHVDDRQTHLHSILGSERGAKAPRSHWQGLPLRMADELRRRVFLLTLRP